MNDILNLALILFIVLKIVDLNNPSMLDVIIIALFLINALLSLFKRIRK